MQLQLRRVILFTKDMKTMSDFYENKIGLKVLSRDEGFIDFDAGPCRLALHRAGSIPSAHAESSCAHKICFYAEDVSKVRAELVARGIAMGKDPGPGEGLKLCDGTDPDGNKFQLSNRS